MILQKSFEKKSSPHLQLFCNIAACPIVKINKKNRPKTEDPWYSWKTLTRPTTTGHPCMYQRHQPRRLKRVSIMGTGSGKSNLLNILGILDNYDTGEYYLNGTLIKNLHWDQGLEYRNRMIGFIFQSLTWFLLKCSGECGTTPFSIRGWAVAMLWHWHLDRLGLKDWAHHMPNEMSGGQNSVSPLPCSYHSAADYPGWRTYWCPW